MSVLSRVNHYYERGWCIIPVKHNKCAALKQWKPFQNKRPDPSLLKRWFANGKHYPAVILGEISGGLVCRDFDKMAAYDAWAKEYPDLAKTLATVRRGKGKHVYCASNWPGFMDLDDGELRGSTGQYCVLPPAVHETGTICKWEIELPDGDLPILEPCSIGLGAIQQTKSNGTEEYRTLQKDYERDVFKGGFSQEVENVVREAIERTIPEKQDHRLVFEFARHLKAMPELGGLSAIALAPYVRLWHNRALPYIGTKFFEETWIDFSKAWPRVAWPVNGGFMTEILEEANAEPVEG